MCREDVHLRRRAMVAAVGALVSDRGDVAVAADLDAMHDALCEEPRSTLLCARNVHRGVVLRLDRTNRDAAAVAAAWRTVVARDGIAPLRRRAHIEARCLERLGDRRIQIAGRD